MQNITSTVSHEMKTPLGMIQQFVLLLSTLGHSLTEQRKQKHFLQLIQHQTLMLMGYVNDLLDLRQINTGLYQRKIAVFDPNKEVFDLIIEMFRVQAEMRNIRLTFETVSFLELADNSATLNTIGSNNKSYRMP